jgi:hypothetical protein
MIIRPLFFAFLLSSFTLTLKSQSMDIAFRQPVLEEGDNNIILQNCCGNRLTLLFKPSGTELEFVYKPNAFRRKEFWARNFSNRDNQTVLFPRFSMSDIFSTDATFDYDPFVTRVKINAPSGAKNTITVVNIADENAFVISARSPLLLAFKPHTRFDVINGLLTEKFTERGEEIVSFIKFPGFEQNRFRILADGTYVLQVLENDLLIIGGEENLYQVNRVCAKFQGFSLDKLITRNEALIKPALATSSIYCRNPDFMKVLDINKRILYSMVDDGGATFGALSRCYYLIWVRDGSMSTSLMARAGYPLFIPKWTSLALNNPSVMRRDDGTEVPEFSQLLGTRWSKSEDDGIFYATLSLFTATQTTGNTELLYSDGFRILLEAIDRFLEKAWDKNRRMIGSDTRGETSLKSSPYFGYDAVNGEMYHRLAKEDVNYTPILLSYSLYNQVNTYNLLLMANVLLAANPSMDNGRSVYFNTLAMELKETIKSKFVNPSGNLYSGFELHSDGSEKWIPFGKDCDYWETAWANSLGPYYPVPEVQLSSAAEIKNDWEKFRNYGYCPWNTLSRYLYEYGLSSVDYEKMLSEQVKDALTLTKRFPMKGAVTEYQKETNGWRALPFQIGALYYSLSSQIIQNMPMGIGIRASNFVDSIQNYRFRLAVINARQHGVGDVVASYTLNGRELPYSLQLPTNRLRNGVNTIEIVRGNRSGNFRLYSSTAELLACNKEGDKLIFEFTNPVISQMIFDQAEKAKSFRFIDKNGTELLYSQSVIWDKTILEINTSGDFKLEVQL